LKTPISYRKFRNEVITPYIMANGNSIFRSKFIIIYLNNDPSQRQRKPLQYFGQLCK
jgi:hypothetical protein